MVTSAGNETIGVFPHPIGSKESNLMATWFRTQVLKFNIEDLHDLDDCLDSPMLFAWKAHPQRSKGKFTLRVKPFFSLIGFDSLNCKKESKDDSAWVSQRVKMRKERIKVYSVCFLLK